MLRLGDRCGNGVIFDTWLRTDDMGVARSFGLMVTLASASAAYAGPHDFSQTFRERAAQLCTGDAMRLCLAYLTDEGQTARCMKTNRSQLSAPCRVVVDQGIRIFDR